MIKKIAPTTWVYAIIADPDKNEKLFGLTDQKRNLSFIPIFETKKTANKAFPLFVSKHKAKLEIQAIIFEDLEAYASGKKVAIFIVDEKGNVKGQAFPF